jgi:hypothetical protein
VVVETNIEEARQLLTVVCLDEVDDCQIQKNSAQAQANSRTNADTDLVQRDLAELNCWFHSRTEPAIVDTFDSSF